MRGERRRFQAVEYAKPAPLVASLSAHAELTHGQARELLDTAGERLRTSLSLERVPFEWVGERVQFTNFAGVFLLAPGMELEVAPKFLGHTEGWREDFFLLATLDKHGRLLDDQGIRAHASATSDLFTLIGRSLVEMYWRNQRRPLRAYRRHAVQDFALDGDFDPSDLLLPEEEGFEQVATSFTRQNPYNAVISAAASRLAPVVSDPETRARLERVAHNLPRQALPLRVESRRVPSRARTWQPTYDLAVDILQGLGGSYDAGSAIAPGFVLKTWQAWEALVTLALRMSFGAGNVASQSSSELGRRMALGGKDEAIVVRPDNAVRTGGRSILVDAKYKGNVEAGQATISNADVYEALAFAQATGVQDVVLAYPRRITGAGTAAADVAGGFHAFSTVRVGDVAIHGVEFGVRGISQAHGLRTFAKAFSTYVSELPPHAVTLAL